MKIYVTLILFQLITLSFSSFGLYNAEALGANKTEFDNIPYSVSNYGFIP